MKLTPHEPRRTRLCAALLVALTLSAPALARAQDGGSGTGDDRATDIESVVVTGSRISNPNVVSPTPISVLTAEDIHATGAINIGDVLTQLPQLATTFTMGNSSRFIGTAGVAMQDLRNLGSSRTLVLVNGRRFVGSSAGSSAVDTNLIPAAWIDRVEIITGGASAVYGADAVSGVVNFILKKRYEGLESNIQIGDSEHGGFKTGFASVTGGRNFADERGNFALSLEHSRQEMLDFVDRFGQQSYREILTPGGATDKAWMANAGGYTRTMGGTFSLGSLYDIGKRYVFDPDGSVRKQRFDGPWDKAGACSDCDFLNGNVNGLMLQPKYHRTTLSGTASFDLDERNRLYTEATFSTVDVKQHSSAAFGNYWIEPDNAYIRNDLAKVTGGKRVNIRRYDVDAVYRGESTTRKTGRVVFGADGVWGENWDYDASLVYGRTDERRENLNNRINERFYAGMDAVVDPATGQAVCRSRIDPDSVNANFGDAISAEVAASCVPFSIFGHGAISPGAAQRFNTTTLTKTRLTQFVASGSVTHNDLFTLPGGSASLALGAEHRRETSRQITDPLDVSGQTFLNAIPSSSGSYDVSEGFAEILLPLLADVPFARSLSLSAAARYSQYSTVGDTTAWRYGLDWAPNDSLRIRGTMSSAVRAPNIDELFGGQSENFFTIGSNDPCSSANLKNGKDPALRAANCAASGVPADFIPVYSGTVRGLSGSNPDLDAETGRTWTGGFVFTPAFLSGFSLNVDYWNIKLTDAISSLSGLEVVQRCVDAPSGIANEYCSSMTRGPDHLVNHISSVQMNISAIETDGVDLGVSYRHGLWGGQARFDLNATRVLAYTEYPFQEDPSESIEKNGTEGFPEWKANLGIGYDIGNWDFNWNSRYASGVLRVSNESYESNPTSTTPITAGSAISHDVRASYAFPDSGWQVYAGINNLFDNDPPMNYFGAGVSAFGSAVYDTLGRRYYVGAKFRF